MKVLMLTFIMACLCAVSGCGDSGARHERRSERKQPAPKPKRPPTPEEELGIEMPGKLAASVEAWAGSNELGEYFKQSRDCLAGLHAQLIEDYKVRKESDMDATAFTRETLRKYHEAFGADVELRRFMVECYSRKEVRPLPPTIARVYSTAGESRAELRALVDETPEQLSALKSDLASLNAEMEGIGSFSWSQEKTCEEWSALQKRLSEISAKVGKANSRAAALSANMSKAVRANSSSETVYRMGDDANRLREDWSSLLSRVSRQLEIVNGQVLLAKFSDNCKAMLAGVTSVPDALAKKKARQSEIRDVIRRITVSRTRGYSDLESLAKEASAIKTRSRKEGEAETSLGNRVQRLAGNCERLFGVSAIARLKRDLPEPSARARIDTELESFRRLLNVPAGADMTGLFAGVESKAYQLADRMEEEALLKQMDETLSTVKKLAARRR